MRHGQGEGRPDDRRRTLRRHPQARHPAVRSFSRFPASWQQEIFPLLFAGGHARFSIRADQSGKTTLELGRLHHRLYRRHARFPASSMSKLPSSTATTSKSRLARLRPGIVASMEGRAKLLSGLLGFKFGVEGRVLIYPGDRLGHPRPQRRPSLWAASASLAR